MQQQKVHKKSMYGVLGKKCKEAAETESLTRGIEGNQSRRRSCVHIEEEGPHFIQITHLKRISAVPETAPKRLRCRVMSCPGQWTSRSSKKSLTSTLCLSCTQHMKNKRCMGTKAVQFEPNDLFPICRECQGHHDHRTNSQPKSVS